MFRVFLAESRKLRRPTLAISTLLTVSGLSALFTSIVFLRLNSGQPNSKRGEIVTAAELSNAHGAVYGFKLVAFFLGITALCVFASQTAQEYTHGTLRNLLVRQPSRMKILAGKFAAMTLFALVMVLWTGAVSFVTSYLLAGKGHVNTSLWSSAEGWHYLIQCTFNILISTIGFGTLGMILGLLFRSPITSIAVGVLWSLILETILSAALSTTRPWLPGQNISNIAEGGGTQGISYMHSIWSSLLYLGVGLAIVSTLFKRRDVAN
jgi:ABC-type transport system involved in multi-copper enzyme maturation permease subunit